MVGSYFYVFRTEKRHTMDSFDEFMADIRKQFDNKDSKKEFLDTAKIIDSKKEWHDAFLNASVLMMKGNPASIKAVDDLVDKINAELGEGTVNQDAIAKHMKMVLMPVMKIFNREMGKQYEDSLKKYCRMDEEEFYALPAQKQWELQVIWGRQPYLVASNINMMEECDLDPNFLAEVRGNVYDIYVIYKNRHQGPEWKECTEYADLYIYATEEEIKRYMDSFKNEKKLCDGWFGPFYKLAKY